VRRNKKLLNKKLPTEGVVNWRGKMQKACSLFDRVETVSIWRSAFLSMLESARALIRETESFGVDCTFTEHSLLKEKNSARQAAIEHPVSKRTAKRHRDDSTADSTTGCTGCGRSNQVQDCIFSNAQFFNKTTAMYKGSDAYNKLIAAYPTMKYMPGSIEINAMKNASNSIPATLSSSATAAAPASKFANKKGIHIETYISSILTSKHNADFLMVSLTHNAPQHTSEAPDHDIAALVDTGSLAGDFVALRVIQNIKLTKYIVRTSHRTVCSGLDNKCNDIS
jgi:hypothetical protein